MLKFVIPIRRGDSPLLAPGIAEPSCANAGDTSGTSRSTDIYIYFIPSFLLFSSLVSHSFFIFFHLLTLPAVIYVLSSFLFVSFAIVRSERIKKAQNCGECGHNLPRFEPQPTELNTAQQKCGPDRKTVRSYTCRPALQYKLDLVNARYSIFV